LRNKREGKKQSKKFQIQEEEDNLLKINKTKQSYNKKEKLKLKKLKRKKTRK
jgi:hypothetical protein